MPAPHPSRPDRRAPRSDRPWGRLRMALAVLWLSSLPAQALAGTITITFSGTISSAFGDLGGPLAAGESVTGTIELDDTVVGVFTPGTVFLRAEMLYSGAILSTSLVVDGNPISGTNGNLEVFDSDGPLNGDDSYEATGLVDSGTVAGVVPASFFFNSAYDDPTYTLTPTTPLFGPPPIDPASANQFMLESASGGSAFGSIDDFTVSGAAPVPLLSPLGVGALVAAMAGLGYARTRSG